MKSNALHITKDPIRIFVPLRPLYGVPVYPSVGGDAHIAPYGKCAGVRAGRIILPTAGRRGQHSAEAPATKEPPMNGSVLPRSKKRPPYWVVVLAGAERLELSTRGFGDRCSTN